MDNTKFEAEILGLLNRLKIEKEQIQADCETRLKEIDRRIEAVSVTARLLREPVSERRGVVPEGVPTSMLAGKSAREALIEIAKQKGGTVKITEAIPVLAGAGIIRQTKNSWNALYTTLIRSKEFEKAPGGGTFRLIQLDQPALQRIEAVLAAIQGKTQDTEVKS